MNIGRPKRVFEVEPISIPVELMVALFLGSLGTLALANVRAARRRR